MGACLPERASNSLPADIAAAAPLSSMQYVPPDSYTLHIPGWNKTRCKSCRAVYLRECTTILLR